MAIKQVRKKDGLPFKVSNPKPSKELLEALKEGEQIINDLESGKREGYHNVRQMVMGILKED